MSTLRVAYTTTFDARDVHNWSGTPYHMSAALTASGLDLTYIGNLKRQLPPFFKAKQIWQKYVSAQRESPRFNTHVAKQYSLQVAQHLATQKIDAIVSPLVNPIAYLESDKPIVLWTDALYASLLGFYPPFAYHSANSIAQGNAMTSACLQRVQLAIFSSEWAAQSAIELYGVDRKKVKVVPFGANIKSYPDANSIQQIIKKRSSDTIKLLFLAKSWERKGGDVVLKVAEALHAAGEKVELTIVGYQPPVNTLPPYVRSLGFISKQKEPAKIQQLLAETHFLFVPSRAEAYGIVFCEANAFAVPCLTTYVGGIATIVKDHINGMTFSLHAKISDYCDYIVNVMRDRAVYEALALSSYNEFVTRLNWQVACARVKEMIERV